MVDHPNLATALAAFQGEVPVIVKSKRADVPTKTGGKYSYTYADLAAVTETAMPVLSRHGLSFTTRPRGTEGGGYELQGVLLHVSGERLKGSLPIRGASPQELGSSLTYMRRYLFGCLTGVVTDDDDDGATGGKPQRDTPAEPGPRKMSRNTPAPDDDAGPKMVTQAQSRAMHASFNEAGVTQREARLGYCRNLIGRDIESSSDLTSAEASRIIDALKQDTTPTETGGTS